MIAVDEIGLAGEGVEAGVEAAYPLAPLQQSMLVESLSSTAGGRVGLLQLVWDLPEALDLAAFERAWKPVLARHPILRTRLVWLGVLEPCQEVVREAALPFAVCDWTALPAERRESLLPALLAADRRRGLDLDRAPLLRVTVARLHAGHHQVVLSIHHTTFDGRTLLALIQEVFAGYEALRRGAALDLLAPGAYRDYVFWLARQDRGRAEAFWREALRGLREPTPLGLEGREARGGSPGAPGEPPVWFYRDFSVWLSDAATDSLVRLAGELGLTLNSLLLAAWSLLLSRLSGRPDVLFGVVRTHRGAMPGGPSILGPMMNSVPFRASVDPEAELGPWLQGVRAHWLAMRAGDFASPAEIRSWSEFPPGSPLFETLVLFETHELTERLRQQGPGWRRRTFTLFRQPRLPLSIYGYHEKRLSLKVIFDPARLDPLLMRRLLENLRTTLEAMPEGARRSVGDLPLLSPAERHQVLAEWNDTAGPCRSLAVEEGFEAHARQAPDAIAVVAPGQACSYGEMETRANRLAALLAARGVGPGTLVGVLLERSIQEVQALLGVLKAGGAYVPLESSVPERLDAVLADSGVGLLLVGAGLRPGLRFPAERILDLDAAAGELRRQPDRRPRAFLSPEQPAYVIYTSGSSGRPKGVVVPHRGVANLIERQLDVFGLSPRDRTSRIAGLAFDASVWELWPAWSSGGVVVLPPEPVRSDPAALQDWLLREEVTLGTAPPLIAERLCALRWPAATALRVLFTGGDTVHARPPAGLPFRLLNTYGPTETSVAVSGCEILPAGESCRGEQPPEIGRPFRNLRIHLFSPDLRPIPLGARGELTIGGRCITRGYLGRPDLTAASFVPDPAGGPGERLYRTGDLVRFLPDGAIEFFGRRDSQVKLRGFRVELGEIEVALGRHPAVRECAVVACDGAQPGEKRLVAFLVSAPRLGDDDLRDFLHDKLPAYMIPTQYVPLEFLPLNVNGKVDREALAAQAAAIPRAARDYAPPETALERLLARIWGGVLGEPRVGREDDLFALGAHSLHVMQVLASLREAFGQEVAPEQVFLSSTVAQLAEHLFPGELDRLLAERAAAALAAPPPEVHSR